MKAKIDSLDQLMLNESDSIVLARLMEEKFHVYYTEEDFSAGLSVCQQTLVMFKALQDTVGCADALTNMSLMYDNLGQYPEGLKASLDALDLYSAIDNRIGIAQSLNDIGIFHYYRKDYSIAITYLERSFHLYEELKDTSGMSLYYVNAGNILGEMGQKQKCLDFYQKAYLYDSLLGQTSVMSVSLSNIGEVYTDLGKYKLAEGYFKRAYKIAKATEDVWGMTNPLRGLAELYQKTNRLEEGIKVTKEAIALSESIHTIPETAAGYKVLFELYQRQGKYKQALESHKVYQDLEDSIFNADKARLVTEMESKYQNKEKAKEIELLHKESELENFRHESQLESEEQKQRFMMAGLLGFIIVLGVLLRNFMLKKKANENLREKNDVIEGQKELLENAFHRLEEQNKSTVDSIRYAKRIQKALFKSEEHQSKHLPAHFILFKPKDIVSGDFYWAMEKGDLLYMTVADCTGHGVPGAFLTMLGISFLNEICGDSAHNPSPAEILEQLRARIINELGQSDKNDSTRDGMDISFACLNMKTNQIQWAGANNPLWICRKMTDTDEGTGTFDNDLITTIDGRVKQTIEQDHSILEVKPDKQPVGYYYRQEEFQDNTIQLRKGDMIYLFSDGYADQFGGARGKKFKYKPFKSLLISLSSEPIEKQKEIMNVKFESWRGELEQLDDVCVIGVRV